MIIMKLIFNRDGSGFFPEYLKKRYEKELSCYQILKFEIGLVMKKTFVVGFSLQHKESGKLACLVFNPMDMSCDIKQTDFPRFAFTEGTKLRVRGKFIFGELAFREEVCSFDVCVPRFWYCENLTELKELFELYALLSEDKLLIDAVSTEELPKPVIWDSFAAYAYFLNDEKALIARYLVVTAVKAFALSLENRDPDSCFYVEDKKNLIFPEKGLYKDSDFNYFYFDGECFHSRRGKYVTEKEAQSMKERLSKEYPEASFWKRPLPCTLGWMLGSVLQSNNPVYLGVDLYSGHVEFWKKDDVLFPVMPDDKRFIYDT